MNGNITACTHSGQESLTSADDLNTKEEKHRPVCQLLYRNQGNNSYGVPHDVITVLEVGFQPGSLSLVSSEPP